MTSITQVNKKYGNTKLYRGKLFSSSKDVLRFIQDYSLLQGKSIHVTKKSGRFRMYQCRDSKCTWKVNATITKDKDWCISYIHDEHLDTCTIQSHLTSRQIADITGFRANVKADPETFSLRGNVPHAIASIMTEAEAKIVSFGGMWIP